MVPRVQIPPQQAGQVGVKASLQHHPDLIHDLQGSAAQTCTASLSPALKHCGGHKAESPCKHRMLKMQQGWVVMAGSHQHLEICEMPRSRLASGSDISEPDLKPASSKARDGGILEPAPYSDLKPASSKARGGGTQEPAPYLYAVQSLDTLTKTRWPVLIVCTAFGAWVCRQAVALPLLTSARSEACLFIFLMTQRRSIMLPRPAASPAGGAPLT